MIKRDELTDPSSCTNRAREDEALFVLRGHDVTSAATVQHWVNRRIEIGKNKWEDSQIVGAMNDTILMINQSSDPVLARKLWYKEWLNRPGDDGMTVEAQLREADDRYEAICGSLGFHPETELADVIEAIQSVRSEARNYPDLQLKIGSLAYRVRLLRELIVRIRGWEALPMFVDGRAWMLEIDTVLASTESKSAEVKPTEGETVEYKLRSAILDAGFAVMQTSGKWSIVNVTDEAKRQMAVDEKHTARVINENIHLEMWKAEQQQALIKMSMILLDAGFTGDNIIEGLQWLVSRASVATEPEVT